MSDATPCETGLECRCGLPMSKNPHPDAGKTEHLTTVGAVWVCVPCTVKAMSGWASRYHQASRDAARYAERLRYHGIDPKAGLP